MNGEEEFYSPKKFRNSLKRSGTEKNLIDEAQNLVERKLYKGMTTDELYNIAHDFLKGENIISANKYSLKKSILALGPAGYIFEKYMAEVLKFHDFKTKTNLNIKGNCVIHEVDITAQKEEDFFIIEAKFHNSQSIRSDVKTALYTYARFLDIKENKKNKFNYKPWLITNTKFTTQAEAYSKCRGIKITSWNYPKKENLINLIENKELYPVTIFSSVNNYSKEKFSKAGIYLAKDLQGFSATDFQEKFGIFKKDSQKIENEIKKFFIN